MAKNLEEVIDLHMPELTSTMRSVLLRVAADVAATAQEEERRRQAARAQQFFGMSEAAPSEPSNDAPALKVTNGHNKKTKKASNGAKRGGGQVECPAPHCNKPGIRPQGNFCATHAKELPEAKKKELREKQKEKQAEARAAQRRAERAAA